MLLNVPSRRFCCGSFLLNVCFVGGSGSFSHYVCFSFSCSWTPESPPIWERAADSVYHPSHLFTDVTLCCDFFPLVYCGRSLGSDCISF